MVKRQVQISIPLGIFCKFDAYKIRYLPIKQPLESPSFICIANLKKYAKWYLSIIAGISQTPWRFK